MDRHESSLIELGAAIEDGLFDHDQRCSAVAGKIDEWIIACGNDSDKCLNKINKKVNYHVNRLLTGQANQIDQVVTQLLTWISACLASSEWTLTGLAVKADLCDAGQSLDVIEWDQPPACDLGPEYGGTLILDCRGLADQLAPLLEVLREIRDRIGGAPLAVPGEAPETADIALAESPINYISTQNVLPDAPELVIT